MCGLAWILSTSKLNLERSIQMISIVHLLVHLTKTHFKFIKFSYISHKKVTNINCEIFDKLLHCALILLHALPHKISMPLALLNISVTYKKTVFTSIYIRRLHYSNYIMYRIHFVQLHWYVSVLLIASSYLTIFDIIYLSLPSTCLEDRGIAKYLTQLNCIFIQGFTYFFSAQKAIFI